MLPIRNFEINQESVLCSASEVVRDVWFLFFLIQCALFIEHNTIRKYAKMRYIYKDILSWMKKLYGTGETNAVKTHLLI